MFRRLIIRAAAAALMFGTVTTKGLPPSPAPAGAGGGGTETLRLINIPPTKTSAPLELWVARTKARIPAGVLVFSVDKKRDIKTLLNDPAWQNFAEDQQLGMVALVPTGEPPVPVKATLPPSGPTAAVLVSRALDHEYGNGVSLLLYSGPQQAVLAESLLTINPKRVVGWYLRAPDRSRWDFSTPDKIKDAGSATPPGILLCFKENNLAYDALLQDFTRARKMNERVTWIAMQGDHPTESQTVALDAFVRNYFTALLHPRLGMEQWQNIDTKRTVGAAELAAAPSSASYLPHASLLAAWAALHVPGGPELAQSAIVEREVETFNPDQPKIHLYLRKPLSGSKPGAGVAGVLAFCTWFGHRNELVGRLQKRDDFLVRFAEEHRLALLTWDTREAWDPKKSADQRSRQENFQDNLGFDKLANAWERGVHVLCHEAGLPESDFLLYGVSRGAQWAHRLALRKPEHFLAVHIHISSSYDQPTAAAKSILWLETTGDREIGYEEATKFYARCRDLGYPIIFKAAENLGHEITPQIDELSLRFFAYALRVKARREALAASGTRLPGGKQPALSAYALSGLHEAPYYADFINQDVYGADEREMVPAHQRVPLPTKDLALAWGGSVEAPTLLAANNPAVPTTPPGPPRPAEMPASVTPAPAGDLPKPAGRTDAAKTPEAKAAPTPSEQDSADRYRVAVKHAVTEVPALSQTGSASNAAFIGRYQRLKNSNDALLADPSWPEQVARWVKEQTTAHPEYAREFKESVERATLLYPDLAEADSPLNAAFLAEYQRLKDTGDALLTDPRWPEQVAQAASGKLLTPVHH